jgi:hypothetical protein
MINAVKDSMEPNASLQDGRATFGLSELIIIVGDRHILQQTIPEKSIFPTPEPPVIGLSCGYA